MNPDWNWFFSSFSQSAAALIGIIAAFIISKLLNLNEKIDTLIDHFDDLVIEYEKIKSGLAIRSFSWYNENIFENSNSIKIAMKNDKFESLDENQVVELLYQVEPKLFKDDIQLLILFNKLMPRVQALKQRELNGFYDSAFPEPTKLFEKLNNERALIDSLKIDSDSLIQSFHKNKRQMISLSNSITPIKNIIIILIIAFPITVIYPLHFLPYNVNTPLILSYKIEAFLSFLFSLNGILLIVFFITIEIIFLYFIALLNKYKLNIFIAINNNHDTFQLIESYSHFLI